MISCAQSMVATAWRKSSTWKRPSSSRNLSRLIEARLQAESSTCMYSEQGLEALMRPELGQVCQWLIIVSNCMPGSPQSQVAWAMRRSTSRAFTVSSTSSPTMARSSQSRSWSTACMKSSVARTELLAFWNWMEAQASPLSERSQPAAPRSYALRSSRALHSMNSSTSGWSALSTTILAARRVLPPDLIDPAIASAPRMKDTGPDACPPAESCSRLDPMAERVMPEPEPPLNIIPSVLDHYRIDSIVSSTERMKQAEHCGFASTPPLNQTGLLKQAIWWSIRYFNSSWKAWASSSERK